MASWEEKITTNDIAYYSDVNNLKNGAYKPFPNYALLLPKYSKLNGIFQNVVSIDTGNVGYVSKSISDNNGNFATYPRITFEYARQKTAGGVDFIFNEVSDDYPTSIQIKWYKGSTLLDSKDYTISGSSFIARNEVSNFNKVVIIFKATNKPNRPVYVAYCKNYKITQTDGLKIIYYDTAYKGKQYTTNISGDATSYSEYQTLLQEIPENHPEYAMLLPKYSKLSGDFINAPSTMEKMGYVSNYISKADRTFDVNPKLTFTLSQYITSLGFSIYGNDASGDYASKVKIKYFRDDNVLHEATFEPNAVDYFYEHKVEYYNKVVLEFIETSKPYRNAFVRGFDYGVVRIFTEEEITKCNCYEEINPISTELSINTLDFEIKNVKGLAFDFQKSQKCQIYFNDQIIGNFYLKSGTRESEKRFSFKNEDYVSLLDENYHVGGIYENKVASDLIREIFANEDVELIIDETFDSVLVSGYLPYDTKRNNLAQLCLAIGGIVDTSFDDSLYIYPSSSISPEPISEGEIFSGSLNVDYGDVITGVNLSVHNYIESEETQQLFKDTLTGQATITFNEPAHDLTITGGTIKSSGVNYAVVEGDGSEITLTGKKYNHEVNIITMENTLVSRGRKYMDVTDATLITKSNANQVLNRLYYYYVNNQSVKADILLGEKELTDIVSIPTFDGVKKGMIISLDMTFTNEIRAEANIKCQDN